MEMANGKDERIAELTKELDESHANLKKVILCVNCILLITF